MSRPVSDASPDPSGQLTAWIERLLVRELEGFEREIGLCGQDLLWGTLPGLTNPIGTLALHVAGNLQHFVGHVLGRSSYVRDRDREFRVRDLSSEAIVAELRAASAVVKTTMAKLPEEALVREYPEPVAGVRMITGLLLTHLCVHAGFHLGQAGYLRRALSGQSESAGAISVKPLAI